ncbi:hypothetical protein, partial [Sinorhizobium terangae]|uniref:hypothetical protein n=1 Tax=Sinorhizobium terangae TaxID=110322 RepID=UPI001AEEAE7F
KVIVASSAAALVSDRAYRPAPFPQSTAIFKKNDSFLTNLGSTRLCRSKILFSPNPPPCGDTILPSLLHNRPI